MKVLSKLSTMVQSERGKVMEELQGSESDEEFVRVKKHQNYRVLGFSLSQTLKPSSGASLRFATQVTKLSFMDLKYFGDFGWA